MRAEIDQELNAAVILHCADCRFSDSKEYGINALECLCPKQPQWADRAATGDFTFTSLMRRLHCHGDWWEARLPDPPRGWQRFLCWLRRGR